MNFIKFNQILVNLSKFSLRTTDSCSWDCKTDQNGQQMTSGAYFPGLKRFSNAVGESEYFPASIWVTELQVNPPFSHRLTKNSPPRPNRTAPKQKRAENRCNRENSHFSSFHCAFRLCLCVAHAPLAHVCEGKTAFSHCVYTKCMCKGKFSFFSQYTISSFLFAAFSSLLLPPVCAFERLWLRSEKKIFFSQKSSKKGR